MANVAEIDRLELRRQENDRMIEGVTKAVRRAILEHKRAGNPICTLRDGKVVWIPAEEIDVEGEQ